VKGAKIVAEMKDISTTVDNSLFEVPVGYSKVPPQQVKQQIDAVTNAAAALVKALLSNMATTSSSSTPSSSPTATSSPSPRD
jgi:hypothetical protein